MAIAAVKLSLAVKKVDIGKATGVPASSNDFAKKLNHEIQKSAKSNDSTATPDSEQAQNKPQELPEKASDAPANTASDGAVKTSSDAVAKKGQNNNENSQSVEDSSPADVQDSTPQTANVPTEIFVQQADEADDDESDAPSDKSAKGTPKAPQVVTPDVVVVQQPVQPKVPEPQKTQQESPDQVKSTTDAVANDKNVSPVNVNLNDMNAGDSVAPGEKKEKVGTKQVAVKDTRTHSDQVDDSSAQDAAAVQTTTPKTAKPQAIGQAPQANAQAAQSVENSSADDTTSDTKQTSSKPDFVQVLQMRMPDKAVAQTSDTHATPPANPQPQNINIEQRFIDANHPPIISGVRGQLMPHGGTLQLRLDPPELGAMNVTMKIDDGTVTASFQTTNSEATRLLSHSLSDLKSGLESAGVSVDKLHVTQVSHEQMNSNDFDQRGSSSQQGASQQQQEQQRREMMRRLWRKVSGGDPLDLVA